MIWEASSKARVLCITFFPSDSVCSAALALALAHISTQVPCASNHKPGPVLQPANAVPAGAQADAQSKWVLAVATSEA